MMPSPNSPSASTLKTPWPPTKKYHWRYHAYTTRSLHWGWIVALSTFMAWSIHYGMHFALESPPVTSLAIQDPHFYSISKTEHPYHIYAQSIQFLSPQVFAFQHPWAEYAMPQQTLSVKSQQGTWHDGTSTLFLQKKVIINDNLGQIIETENATVMYKKKEISSISPTQGTSPKGHFASSGFSWTDKTLHLHGPVKAILHVQS